MIPMLRLNANAMLRRIRMRFGDCKFASGSKFVSATIRDGYKFELGTRLGVHGVGAVGSALVIVFLGAIGGALQFPLACV